MVFYGFLESRVYVNRPKTLEVLKNIQEEIASITLAMVTRVMTNARNQVTQCMENGGRYLSNLIFKTMQNKTLDMRLHYKKQIKMF